MARNALRLLLPWMLVVCAANAADEPLEELIRQAVLDYNERIQAATEELATTRREIAEQRVPLLDQLHALETEIAKVETEIARLTVEKSRLAETTKAAQQDRALLDRNLAYITNVVLEAAKAYESSQLPAEILAAEDELVHARQRIEAASQPNASRAALDAAEALVRQLERQIGGYTVSGHALAAGDNTLVPGTFAFTGPAVFFLSDDAQVFGAVRERPDSAHVVTHPVEAWDVGQVQALMKHEPSVAPFDASHGKALQLLELRGSIISEIRKGGVVGYVILGLGAAALVLVVMKMADMRVVVLDSPETMRDVALAFARGDTNEVRAILPKLRTTTRGLVEIVVHALDAPRSLMEEQLEGFVLRQRLLLERRLPLLAVIATAGPLLGLLGTVTGMIKTFTLITVFGTGSAARLSGGISEALVATALGLAVAIPALLIHGLLSHRIHKSVGAMERYAVELVTAVEPTRDPEPSKR